MARYLKAWQYSDMIRRDYIVQMIEECIQALARIRGLRQEKRWQEAGAAVDVECEKLAATGAQDLAKLSETELLARVSQEQPTHTVRARLFMIVSLLQEAAEIAAAQDRLADAREAYLKALNVLLDVLDEDGAGEHPAFVPKVEALVESLAEAPLPVRTRVLLMQHYESTGQLGKAEDMLYSILDGTANDRASLELGVAFYERVLGLSDSTLSAGDLPRAEALEGLRELKGQIPS
jgi:hypothetical protein